MIHVTTELGMQLDLPCFEDDAIDDLLRSLPAHTVISVRGIPGSGKTVFAEYLIAAALSAGETTRVALLGPDALGQEFLNQATGVGADLLTALPSGRLALEVLNNPTLQDLCCTVSSFPEVDLFVVDSLDKLPSNEAEESDRILSWLVGQANTSLITIGESAVGSSRTYADLVVDFEQLSGDEDFWYADSVLTIERPATNQQETRAFRIEGYTVQLWEAQ